MGPESWPRQVEGHQVTAGDASLSAAERLEVRLGLSTVSGSSSGVDGGGIVCG